MQGKVKPLSPNNLRLVCDPASLTFETTADLQPTTAIIGQPRATKALEFGMGLKSKGYNIFVTGSTGTGRSTAIRHFLQERCGLEATPDDLLYVHNFEAAHRPQAISLPPGQGSDFAEHMKQLIEAVQLALTQAFESKSYREAIHALEQKLLEQREEKLDALDRRATEQGFDLQDSPAGLVILVAGEEEAGEPSANGELQTRRETQRGLQMELQSILREVRIVEREAREERRQLDQQVAEAAVQDEFDTLREKYTEQLVISAYLDVVREDLVEQVTRAAPALDEKDLDQVVDLRRYEVNVLINNADGKGAPVIVQLNPTYENLFGRLEYETQGHAMTTHFTQIKAGDLHRANGGYLVMYALDLIFRQRETWEALKRTLKAQEIEMRSPSSDAPAIANSLWPQPIPLNLKVILLGHSNLYESLYWNDEEFSDLFKVRADFSDSMPRDPANELSYAEFVASRSQEEKLRPFGRAAVAKIIEHGARLAEHQCKLSTRFGAIADLARESNYWAGIDGRDVVTADDVRHALNERTHRASQEAEQVREEILEGMIFIATEGEIVGQVNGLSVREVGDFSFGHPGCISARTFMGESGVVHIERETEMDGPIHEKGVLTLNGYLGGTYAQHQPLSLSASLTFEQTYGGIDGDSASSSELYALISSLSGLPARQGISVTGSVNQRGEIQPIGAVNEKIEGFFDVCRARGLTGDQGVLIPATNIVNLMLREDVVDTVGKGLFHIWPVSNIDEGIELLMGRPAGEPDDNGEYTEGTVHHAVKKRLMELAMELKSFGDDRGHDQADEEN
ncbi:MAG: AAA family ATPase [Candidatus Promineofilum sp.]|nr:AAA family ATPase [Promineifilum sp.]